MYEALKPKSKVKPAPTPSYPTAGEPAASDDDKDGKEGKGNAGGDGKKEEDTE